MFAFHFTVKLHLLTAVTFALCGLVAPGLAEEEDIRVFSLQHANCFDMESIVKTLSRNELVAAPDRRTNSLVVVGPKDALSVVEAVLMKLDQPVAKHESTADKTSFPESDHGAKIVSPANAKILSVAQDGAKVKQGDKLATLQPNESSQSISRQIEIEVAQAHERLRMNDQKQALMLRAELAKQMLELVERRLSQSEAESALKKLMLESEILNAKDKYAALKARTQSLESKHDAGEASVDQVVVANAETSTIYRLLPILQQQLELYEKHTVPLERMRLQLEHLKVSKELVEIQAAISNATRAEKEAQKARGD